MANPNYLNPLERKNLISDIKSQENIDRKNKCLKDYEIYNDNAKKYVYQELVKQLSSQTACQMPVISNLNVAKAVVNKEATIYTEEPEREYDNITEKDKEVLESIYADCAFDSALSKANKYYKLRNQTFIQVVPKYGKIKLRVVHGQNIDVVPEESDPEQAFAYIISSFDKAMYQASMSDGVNQKIADADDYKALAERYQVFTKEITFIMNGNGDILGEGILPNPIEDLPFVDVSKDKDFEFYVRIGQALTDFTVDYNVAWSDLMFISRMQGYSVGVLSGDPNLKPESMTIGPNRLLFLPKNPSNPDSSLELDFKSPTPNLDSSLKIIDSLVASFLSTRGIDPKSISVSNSGNSYSSALEKLLSMIDQFKATKDDFDLFKSVEYKLHRIVCKYLSLLTGTNLLDPKYNVSQSIVNSELYVKFKEPQMVETTSEKLDNSQKKIDLGISDRVAVLADINGVSIDMAQKEIEEIDLRKAEQIKTLQGKVTDVPNENQA